MLNAYLKPTNYCNIDCTHCYLSKEVRADKRKMSLEQLEKVFLFLREMLVRQNKKTISLIWHGGEPLVLPSSYFIEAGKLIDNIFFDYNVLENIQTSLIPFNETYVEVVRSRWGSFIGSSVDFNSRMIKGSALDYQTFWLDKVSKAKEFGITIIPSMVPSKLDCKNSEFIYDWFKENGFWNWNFDRYSNFNNQLINVPSNKEHSLFMIGLFNKLIGDLKNIGYAPFMKPIVAGISGVINGLPGDRWGTTCQSDFIIIEPDGSLNTCPDRSSYEKPYSNIFEGVDSFISSPMRKKWIRIQQSGHRIDDCYYCENSSWCKSACPITENACQNPSGRDDCSGYKLFITHIRDSIKNNNEIEQLLIEYISQKRTPTMNQNSFLSRLPN